MTSREYLQHVWMVDARVHELEMEAKTIEENITSFVMRICSAMMKKENMTKPMVMTYIKALPILSPTEDKPSNSVLQTLKPLSSNLLGSMTSPFTGTLAAVRPAY